MKTIFRFFTGILIFLSLTIGKDLLSQNLTASVRFLINPQTNIPARVAEVSQADDLLLGFDDEINLENDLTSDYL